jgi:hypothetical protein
MRKGYSFCGNRLVKLVKKKGYQSYHSEEMLKQKQFFSCEGFFFCPSCNAVHDVSPTPIKTVIFSTKM